MTTRIVSLRLENRFHETRAIVRAEMNVEHRLLTITAQQRARMLSKLCPSRRAGCTCSSSSASGPGQLIADLFRTTQVGPHPTFSAEVADVEEIIGIRLHGRTTSTKKTQSPA